jgi:hypothetical protein
MELMWKIDQFTGGASPDESKFEKPEVGESVARSHFARKLQKVFPLPPYRSEPDDIRILLRKIQAKFDKPPVPGGR